MADPGAENGQEKEGVETLSVLNEKRQYLLNELSVLMQEAGGVYGPFFMKELQRRLELVVQNFNEELKALIKNSFEKWKIKDSQMRDLLSGNLQFQKSQPLKDKSEESSTPDFIKDVEFGPLHRK